MYLPSHFQIGDLAWLHALIRGNALGTVICMLDGELEANHVPVLLDAGDTGYGRLRFHLARANRLCRALDGGRPVLFVFQGEQAYISPDWYRNPHGVPTWNYAAVHAHGAPRPLDDAQLRTLLEDLSADQERHLDKQPFTVDKLPADL